jgi:glucose-1-phosphate cytidylyltransferase
MKVVILAGGFGTRLSEETEVKPKPMVEIGGKPILWHIMKTYSHYGYNDFVICLGYKGFSIKEYFHHYYLHNSDVTFDMTTNHVEYSKSKAEPWKVTLVETGINTMTGGRIKRIQDHIGDEPFMLTYGDGVSDVNIKDLFDFHQSHGKLATLTAVQPSGKFGSLAFEDNGLQVKAFQEKPKSSGNWINGGFFILQPEIFDFLSDSADLVWEKGPLEKLANDDQLMSYKHNGFWHCMDTMKDNKDLNDMWDEDNSPWKVWND